MEKTTTKARALFQTPSVEEHLNNFDITIKMSDCGDISVFYPETVDKETVIDILLLGILQLRQQNQTKVE